MACLDTTFLIDLAGRGGRRRQGIARDRLRELQVEGDALVTTRFNVAELWVGVMRSRSPAEEQSAVESVLSSLVVLEFDEAAARVFGSIVAGLQERGRPIGDMDALIASVALTYGQSVITRNVRHFIEVQGLIVESY